MNRIALALAAGLFALVATAPVLAQDKKVVKEEVSFKTFDGVLLKGTFYPSQKGGNSPVVMFLHKLGGSRTQGDWESLAIRLQLKGYAVLAFDFRGHGASTTIDPKVFWNFTHNQNMVKGFNASNPKKTIAFKDFNNYYIPYLVNDIATARHDLDNRNDNGQVNTSNIVVIGAEEGASLGFFWVTSEFWRPGVYTNPGFGAAGRVNNDPAGDDIAGAIWLSVKRNPAFGAGTGPAFPYMNFVQGTPPVRDIQMWFAAGEKDVNGKNDAAYMYERVLNADKKKDQLPLTSKKPIEGSALRGVNLIGKKDLPTDTLIEQFIDAAVKKRPNQAQKQRKASEFKPPIVYPTFFGFAQ